ncbi:MAG: hypothetical protein JWM95_2131 [Gemmatimonadetes bacterium]|nr:hypothetical protein [Gemmatimonadota bacterium]
MMDETRLRFLAAIAKQIPAERVIEAHFFPGIRQGGMESGVAVLALERTVAAAVEEPPQPAQPDDDSPYVEPGEEMPDEAPVLVAKPASRYTVYTARYRYTLKGLDRGKWEVSVTDEADAPLLTVDAVVRGVQRRSGDVDDAIRLSGDEFRAALPTVAA